jgi:hypothetical protein
MSDTDLLIISLIGTALIIILNLIAVWQREHQRRAQRKLLQYKEEQINGRDET